MLEKSMVSRHWSWSILPWEDKAFTVDDILHHVIAHEIHHVGQLSIWAREIDRDPVQANVIGRNLVK